MPFGKYKGLPLAHVPAGYLLWLYDNYKCSLPLRTYIRELLPVLQVQHRVRPNQHQAMMEYMAK